MKRIAVCHAMSVPVRFEAAFIEDTVSLTIKLREEGGDRSLVQLFNTQKDMLYEKKADGRAFRAFYETYFRQLGLNVVFETTVMEYPLLKRPNVRIFVRRVFSRKQEGSELYRDGDFKTVLLGVRTDCLTEPVALRNFLRHELLRVSDMLDPAFEYSPAAGLEGVNPAENELIRERFSVLWDRSIRSRLNEDRNLPRPTQKELLTIARGEIRKKNYDGGGFICPACGFPSFDKAPSMDSCRQCFEMVQAQEASSDARR